MLRNATHKLLLITFFLAVVDPSLADCPRDIAQTAGDFVSLFASDKLSVDTARMLIGNEGLIEHHGAYWQIQSSGCLAEIMLRAETQAESVEDAELRLQFESGLLLSDLEKNLGSWQLVFASKTSSVSFRVADKSGKPTIVFARLFTPNPFPGAPVLSLQLRRGARTQEP